MVRFFCKFCCSLTLKIERTSKKSASQKMFMYLFSIFNEPKDNDRITSILTCSDTNSFSFLRK